MQEGYVMSWVSTLTPYIHFGPKPESMKDIIFLKEKKHIDVIINLLPITATFTKVPLNGGPYSMKRVVNMSCSYLGFYEVGDCPINHTSMPFDPSEIASKGRLKEDQMRNLAKVYVDHARKVLKIVSGFENKNSVVYVHAKDGFMTEAFIAFAIWGINSRGSSISVAAIDEWFKQATHLNQNIFHEDPENFELLKCIWSESRKPKSPFEK